MMRISKYVPVGGIGCDAHGVLPPSTPPVPPNPALIPTYGWMVAIVTTASAQITGKWSMMSVSTEGMGDILWQYDWGFGQPHIPVPPLVTPSLAILVLASSTKYWMPSFAVKERIDGGALASMGGGDAPVAISSPAFCVITQNCQDVGGACIGLVAPTSICFQAVSARWVGFNAGDFFAGLLGMIGDALSAAMLSYFGGKLLPKSLADNQALGALAGTLMGQLANVIQSLPWGGVVMTGSTGLGLALAFCEVAGGPVMLAPVVSWAAGKGGEAIGDTWGSRPGDVYTPPPEPAPAPAPAPSSPSSDGGALPGGVSDAPDGGTLDPADGGV